MIISPSVLSLDYTDTKRQIEMLNQSKAEWMHFDVMDGHFVPNLTFGPDILKAFSKISPLYKDVHIMVDNPSFVTDIFLNANADLITFHYEACQSIDEIKAIAKKIHNANKKAGISVKPKTPISVLKPLLKDFDLFLIMSVEPGFGGQSFIDETPERIRELKEMLIAENVKAYIEIDGGINQETGKICKEAGADVLVAGSYVFKNDIEKAVDSLWQL